MPKESLKLFKYWEHQVLKRYGKRAYRFAIERIESLIIDGKMECLTDLIPQIGADDNLN